jgi:hypothetical protein
MEIEGAALAGPVDGDADVDVTRPVPGELRSELRVEDLGDAVRDSPAQGSYTQGHRDLGGDRCCALMVGVSGDAAGVECDEPVGVYQGCYVEDCLGQLVRIEGAELPVGVAQEVHVGDPELACGLG